MVRLGSAVAALGALGFLTLLLALGVLGGYWHAAATAPPPDSGVCLPPDPSQSTEPRSTEPTPTPAPPQPEPQPQRHTATEEQPVAGRDQAHVILVPVEVKHVTSAPSPRPDL